MVHITPQTRQSEMAYLARRATRWVGTFPYILTPIPNLYDHSFPRYGQITFLTFRRPTTLTFDLKLAEILDFEILRKHGQTHKQTHKHTNKQTNRHGHYNTSPSPYGGGGGGGEVQITFWCGDEYIRLYFHKFIPLFYIWLGNACWPPFYHTSSLATRKEMAQNQ